MYKNTYRIKDNYIVVELDIGSAIIDIDDIEILKHRWRYDSTNNRVVSTIKGSTLHMSRAIGSRIGHIDKSVIIKYGDGNTRNNRKSNIRIVSRSKR